LLEFTFSNYDETFVKEKYTLQHPNCFIVGLYKSRRAVQNAIRHELSWAVELSYSFYVVFGITNCT